MGISIRQLGVILSLKDKIKEKRVLSLGVQFPPTWKSIVKFKSNFPDLISDSDLIKLSKTTPKNFQIVLFQDILGAQKIFSLDISQDEGADYIWNLNEDISGAGKANSLSELKSNFDFIFEGGTLEHASNTGAYLNNVFFLLKPKGIYCLSVPTSGYFEHGFFQFSPTFFADLCIENSPSLKLLHLSVDASFNNLKGVILNSFYPGLNVKFPPESITLGSIQFYRKNYVDTSIATGTLLTLINRTNASFVVTAVIQKNHEFSFTINAIQSIYRNNTLGSIVGEPSALITKIVKTKMNLKSIVLNLPIGSKNKFKIITFILSILGERAPKKKA